MVMLHVTKLENVIAKLMWLDKNVRNVKVDTTDFQNAHVILFSCMLPSKLNFSFGLACGCHPEGYTECDSKDGTCYCKGGYTGPKCEECSVGYFGFPNCRSILVLIKV